MPFAFTEAPLPGEIKARRLLENLKFDTLKAELKRRYSPGLLWRAILFQMLREGKNDKIAYWVFVDLFGAGPQWSDRQGKLVHLEDPDFDEWMRIRAIRSKRQWQSKKTKLKKAGKWKPKPHGESAFP